VSVYVDDAIHRYGRMIMCHMWADTEAELLAMADAIGVARKWVQRPPKASWVHFDICKTKRALAVRAGAIETDRFGPLEHEARLPAAAGRHDLAERQLRRVAEARARRTAEGGFI
jgi:hypothetical protein